MSVLSCAVYGGGMTFADNYENIDLFLKFLKEFGNGILEKAKANKIPQSAI